MKTTRIITTLFILLMALAFAMVGWEALVQPRTVMANVGILLNNPSALSSIRAIYGGMHLAFALFCIYAAFREQRGALLLIALYASGFVVGRLAGWAMDGPPNAFVQTWLITETICAAIAGLLIWQLNRRTQSVALA